MDPMFDKLYENLTSIFPSTPKAMSDLPAVRESSAFAKKFSVECILTESGVGALVMFDGSGKRLTKKMFESAHAPSMSKMLDVLQQYAIDVIEGKVKVEDKEPGDEEKELIEQQKTVKEGLEVTISNDNKEVKVSDDGNKVKVTTKGETPEEKAAKEEEEAATPVTPAPEETPAPVEPAAPVESKVAEAAEEKADGVLDDATGEKPAVPDEGEKEAKEVEKQIVADEKEQKKDLADANKEVRDEVAVEGKVAVGDKDPAALEKELIETIALRPFVAVDWDGLAGAEKPSETQEPLIGEIKLDGKDAVVVVDKNSVHVIAADGERQVELSKDMAFDEGKKYAAEMSAENTQEQLVTNGFVVVLDTSESTKRIKTQAVVEADSYKVIAAGLTDKAVADKIAQEKKGRVISDDTDAKKFMVVVGEKK